MEIAVIGAGPSGIMAALQAARGGAQVSLFEHNDRIGRKLLVTGSGRCNLSNASVAAERYHCADSAWMRAFLDQFPLKKLLEVLNELGIPTHHTDDGWYYPLSDSAHSVVAILEEALLAAGVKLRVATNVNKLEYSRPGFLLNLHIKGRDWYEHFDQLVLAAGGRAYPMLGSRGELFSDLSRLGHFVSPLKPALGPIYTELGAFKTLQGLRFDARASVRTSQDNLGETFGNLIVTAEGFNGPGVMNLSHLVALAPKETLFLEIDFLAPFGEVFLKPAARKKAPQPGLLAALEAFFAPKAAEFFISQANLSHKTNLGELSPAQRDRLLAILTASRFPITGAGNFANSQVTIGGVGVTEADPLTCQSRLVPGLYLVGETLDVAGPCGGYNLHFAFGSGFLAGKSLASQKNELKERS